MDCRLLVFVNITPATHVREQGAQQETVHVERLIILLLSIVRALLLFFSAYSQLFYVKEDPVLLGPAPTRRPAVRRPALTRP